MDHTPVLRDRMVIRLHLMMCSFCRRFEQQIRFLRRSARQFARQPLSIPLKTLSTPARNRIKHALRTGNCDADDSTP